MKIDTEKLKTKAVAAEAFYLSHRSLIQLSASFLVGLITGVLL